VAATYAVVAFVVIQVADLVFPALNIPPWAYSLVVVLTLLGFPVALVLAWAFEMTPEGVRRTPDVGDREPASVETPQGSTGSGATPDEAPDRSRRAAGALVALGLLGLTVAGAWYLTGSGGASPDAAAQTVAVPPFDVSGSGAEELRRTIPSLLTRGVDGAAGLRAIPSRTVFAEWEASGHANEAVSSEETVAVARRVGARFAMVGQAVAAGSDLSLTVDVRDTGSGESLGQAEVRGSSDSVMALGDRLSRQVLGILLEEGGGGLPSVDLGRLYTEDDSALRAFLNGERRFRTGDVAAALDAYRAAIDQDSLFALAYTRLSNAAGWNSSVGEREPLLRAYQLADQLPRRERSLTEAMYMWVQSGDRLAAADALRRLTEAYPDDPTVWYNLGEVLWHGHIPPGWPAAEDAFERAVELDPGVAPYHNHLVDLAASFHRDSALMARRIEVHPGREDRKRLFRLAGDLLFGSQETRSRALGRIENVPVPEDWALWMMLRHPIDGAIEDTVVRILLAREDSVTTFHSEHGLVLNDLEHGRIERALRDLEEVEISPAFAACYLAGSLTVGLPIPDSVAAAHLDPSNLDPGASLRHLKCSGIYLVERGRSDELEALASRIRTAPHDSTFPTVEMERSPESAIELLEGYRAWKAGDMELASRRLSESSPWNWWQGTAAIWRGDFYRDLGRLEETEGWYEAAWWHPVAHERLGRLYEAMGRTEEAVAAYQRFVAGWEDVDEPLQPRVEAARERMERLLRRRGARPADENPK
jgi:tetratricopeptide (TPR) repeat protein